MPLPPCGIYRMRQPLADHIPAGRLVYFHNHGDPGPGVYLPARWNANRAEWQQNGHVIPSDAWASAALEPLLREGLYRVTRAFTCCATHCRTFPVDLLVQLGYDGAGHALLFVPEWGAQGLGIPLTGSRLDDDRLVHISPLVVAEATPPAPGIH